MTATPDTLDPLLRRLALTQRERSRLAARLRQLDHRQAQLTHRLRRQYAAIAGADSRPWVSPHGACGYRPGRPAVELLPGLSPAEVVARVRALAPHYLQVAERLERRRLLADRRRPELQRLLPQLGLAIVRRPRFYIHPLAQPLSPQLAPELSPDEDHALAS